MMTFKTDLPRITKKEVVERMLKFYREMDPDVDMIFDVDGENADWLKEGKEKGADDSRRAQR